MIICKLVAKHKHFPRSLNSWLHFHHHFFHTTGSFHSTWIGLSLPIANRFTSRSAPPVTSTRPVSPMSRHDTFWAWAVVWTGRWKKVKLSSLLSDFFCAIHKTALNNLIVENLKQSQALYSHIFVGNFLCKAICWLKKKNITNFITRKGKESTFIWEHLFVILS